MEVYQSIHTGDIDTQWNWIERIAKQSYEDVTNRSFEGELANGNLVPVFLELATHRMGKVIDDRVEWTCAATDDDGNEYILTAYSPVGETATWNEWNIYAIEEVV